MILTILGVIALTRHIFRDEGWVNEGSRRRYKFPRDLSQDIIEHRFGHIRPDQGTHKNPKKEAAFASGMKADAVRNAQQSKRRKSDRGSGPFRLDLGGDSARATMPVSEKQSKDPMRTRDRDRGDFIFEARSLRLRSNDQIDVGGVERGLAGDPSREAATGVGLPL